MAKKKVNKQDLANKFTEQLMNEIGLEIGECGTVVDQDTGLSLQFNGKTLKYSHGDQPPRVHLSDSLLNPIGDLKQAKNLFSYYLRKEELEQTERTPGMFFSVPQQEEKCCVVLQYTDENGALHEFQSKAYNNESVCYADLIMQYNGEENVNLEEFDFDTKVATKRTTKNKRL